jgi:hypothetical protein
VVPAEFRNVETEFWSRGNGTRFATNSGWPRRRHGPILALHPTVAQLEEVRMRLNGEDGALGHRPLGGVVAEIFDMLKVDEGRAVAPGRQP